MGRFRDTGLRNMLMTLFWPWGFTTTIWQHLILRKDENPRIRRWVSHQERLWRVAEHIHKSCLNKVLPTSQYQKKPYSAVAELQSCTTSNSLGTLSL